MSDQDLGRAILELRTDIKGLTDGLAQGEKRAKGSMDNMVSQAKRAGAMILGAFGVSFGISTLVREIDKSIQAFVEQEKASAELRNALVATGRNAEGTAERLEEMSSALQRVTIYGDETTTSATALLQRLSNLGEEGLKQIIPLVQDFASGMNMDLNSAAQLVGKTLGSTTNALGRYGIQIDATASQEVKLAQLTEQLRGKFGGLSEAMGQTGYGALLRYRNAIGDLREEGGRVILEFLTPYLNKATELLTKTLQAWSAQRNLTKALKGEATTVYELDKAIAENNRRRDEARQKLVGMAAQLGQEQKAFDEEAKKIAGGSRALTSNIGARATVLASVNAGIEAAKRDIAAADENAASLAQQREELAKLQSVKSADVVLTDAQASSTEQLNQKTAAYTQTVGLLSEIELTQEQRVRMALAAYEAKIAAEERDRLAAERLAAEQFNLAASFKAIEASGRDLSNILAGTLLSAWQDIGQAIGTMLVDIKDGWEAFKNAAKNAIAQVLMMFGTQWAAEAIGAFPNIPLMLKKGLAATAAFAGAGLVKAMAGGGVIDEPVIGRGLETGTSYVLGEAGPERVSPMGATQEMIQVIMQLDTRIIGEIVQDLLRSRKILVPIRSVVS